VKIVAFDSGLVVGGGGGHHLSLVAMTQNCCCCMCGRLVYMYWLLMV